MAQRAPAGDDRPLRTPEENTLRYGIRPAAGGWIAALLAAAAIAGCGVETPGREGSAGEPGSTARTELERLVGDPGDTGPAEAERVDAGRGAAAVRAQCPISRFIAIDATRPLGPARFREQGFLHGMNAALLRDPTYRARIENLAPIHNWRIGSDGGYDAARGFGARTITYGISCNPFGSSAEWTSCARARVQAHRPGSDKPVEYWEIFNEPDLPVGGRCMPTQLLLQRFQEAHDAIRSVDPDAKIVGPTLAVYSDAPCGSVGMTMRCFLDFIERRGLQFDALAWHEVLTAEQTCPAIRGTREAEPPQIGGHVANLRALLAAHPGLKNPDPELHVNEYCINQNCLIAGWSVAWLRYLEEQNIAVANHTCVNIDEGKGFYSTCINGVTGMLLQDDRTPRTVYWPHAIYSKMGGARVATSHAPVADTVAYATRDDENRQLAALVGRWSVGSFNPPAGVRLSFAVPPEWGLRSMRVRIWKIDAGVGAARSLARTFSGRVDVVNGRIEQTLPCMEDGSARLLEVHP